MSGWFRLGFVPGIVTVVACVCLLHGSGRLVGAATGVPVQYRAGWNLIGGPAGTVFRATGSMYSLGPGDGTYVTSAGDAPVPGDRGYWAFFAKDTTVTLNGPGRSTVSVQAPAGQWLTLGNPSGTQATEVAGADQVLVWDAAAGSYQAVTQLAVGQGAWAVSLDGGAVTLTATGAPLAIPTDTATPAPANPVAPQQGAPTAGLKTYSSPLVFQLQAPADWQQGTLAPGVNYALELRSPDSSQFIFASVTNRGSASNAASACASQGQQVIARVGNGMALMTPVTVPVANADSAALCFFGYVDQVGVPYLDTIVTAIRGQTLYILTLDFSLDFASQHLDLGRQIWQSFQLTTPAQ